MNALSFDPPAFFPSIPTAHRASVRARLCARRLKLPPVPEPTVSLSFGDALDAFAFAARASCCARILATTPPPPLALGASLAAPVSA